MAGALVRWNFHAAVWITIAGGILFLYSMSSGDAGAETFAERRAAGAAIISALQLMNWLWWYRRGEGQGAAAVMALALFGAVVAHLFATQLTGDPVDLVSIVLLSYLFASHALYAAWGWRLRPRSALDL